MNKEPTIEVSIQCIIIRSAMFGDAFLDNRNMWRSGNSLNKNILGQWRCMPLSQLAVITPPSMLL
jgi:hypothetical protein